VRNRGTTIEGLALVVEEEVTAPIPEVVVVEEVVVTGVRQNQLLLGGEAVRPSPSSHDVLLTKQNKALQLL
jgi:hypothetical protein